MTNIVKHLYNGFSISQMQVSSYVSLTDMAKAAGKKVNDYLRLDSTNQYLEALSFDTGCPVSSLIQVAQGKGKTQGTWAHPEIAIDFASWCNVQFRIWANRTLLRGFTNSKPIDEFDSKKQELKAIQAEITATKILLAQKKLSKLKQALEAKPRITKHSTFDEITERVAPMVEAFCKGKPKVSTAEILEYLGTQSVKPTFTIQRIVISCLKQLGFEKDGSRHKIQLEDGKKVRVWTWLAF